MYLAREMAKAEYGPHITQDHIMTMNRIVQAKRIQSKKDAEARRRADRVRRLKSKVDPKWREKTEQRAKIQQVNA